jgi:hypothetical protein
MMAAGFGDESSRYWKKRSRLEGEQEIRRRAIDPTEVLALNDPPLGTAGRLWCLCTHQGRYSLGTLVTFEQQFDRHR